MSRAILGLSIASLAISGLLSTNSSEAAVAEANSFVIRNVRLFDGRSTRPGMTVVVSHGRIASIGRHAPHVAQRPEFDGRGKTLLPGFIDAHVHVGPGAQADALRFGVTTELDMLDPEPEFARWQSQRASLMRTTEADTYSAGIGVTVPNGAPFGASVSTRMPTLGPADDPKAFVDARVREGSDYIKVFLEDLEEFGKRERMPTLTRDQLCGVIAAAHSDGRMAVVHVQAEDAAVEALDCGADGLAHVFPDRVAGADVIERVKRQGTFVETTLDIWAFVSDDPLARQLLDDRRVSSWLSAAQRERLTERMPKPRPSFLGTALENVKRLSDAGVPVLAGSDAPNFSTAHGVSLHGELQLLVRAGLSPVQALRAVTSTPAEVYKLGDRGRIVAGFRADIVLIDGDPTKTISDTLSIDRIWKNGFEIDRARGVVSTQPVAADTAKIVGRGCWPASAPMTPLIPDRCDRS